MYPPWLPGSSLCPGWLVLDGASWAYGALSWRFMQRFDFDEVRFFVFLCVSLQFLCELPVAGCARFAYGIVGLATIDMTSGGWRILLSLQGRAVRGCLVRLVSSVGLLFQPEKSSWFFVPTCFGGPVPLLGTSSSGDSGLLAVLEASDSSSSGDAMADGHQSGRSASTRHVGSDVLLKTA